MFTTRRLLVAAVVVVSSFPFSFSKIIILPHLARIFPHFYQTWVLIDDRLKSSEFEVYFTSYYYLREKLNRIVPEYPRFRIGSVCVSSQSLMMMIITPTSSTVLDEMMHRDCWFIVS